jgi:hypothetical protein
LLWLQKPLPFEPLNLFYSMVFATHRSLSSVKKCWTHYTSISCMTVPIIERSTP